MLTIKFIMEKMLETVNLVLQNVSWDEINNIKYNSISEVWKGHNVCKYYNLYFFGIERLFWVDSRLKRSVDKIL